MNQDSAHSEQDSPVADTAETNQINKISNRQYSKSKNE
jgi:HlyD family secretion protein